MDNLTKAKAQLVIDQPFFASLLLGMPIKEDNRIPTIGTDGEKIVYNKKFLDSMTLPETVFVLAHEVMHCVFQHMYRKQTRNHNKWNIAGDYIINDCLVKEKVGVMPKFGLYDPNIIAASNGTTEGVYGLLPESMENKEAGDFENGGSMDNCMDGAPDEASMAEKEAEMKVKIIQAANAAKMCGKFSQNIQRLVGDFTETKTDWRQVLRRFISEKAKVDLSYSKPKRRWLGEDIIMPSLSGERMGALAVAVDCSGSINDDLLKQFSSEIKAIIQDVMPSVVHVLYFDSEVLRVDTFNSDEEFVIKAVGGGGTAFSPIFKTIFEKALEPTCCVILTDLECCDYGPEPEYPVLWASTGRTDGAQFGEVVKLK